MPRVELDQRTYERLAVAARLMNEPIGAVVRRLVERLAEEPVGPEEPTHEASDPQRAAASGARESRLVARKIAVPAAQSRLAEELVPIHNNYKGHRVEGTFNVTTHEIHLSTAPWTNRHFRSPTAAAEAVVKHYSGDVRDTVNTNGRLFWKLSNGKSLRSIIGSR